ncbi:MAG TPA: acetyl hydrolase, partial [Afipia sp.]|nr:acetyl hydrolase [Afipia sp.]
MPVVLDPDAAAVLDAFREARRPPSETISRAEASHMSL